MKRVLRFHPVLVIVAFALLVLGAGLALAQAGPSSTQQVTPGAPFLVSYQGRVTIDGEPVHGTGYFKFAFVDSQGNYVWTNDMPVLAQTIGQQLAPPAQPVELQVTNGLFNVLLGDASLNMPPITPPVFHDPDTVLRVWFSVDPDGPFEQLPDKTLASAPYALLAEDAISLQGKGADEFAPANHNHWGQTWQGSGTGLTMVTDNAVGVMGRQGASANVPPIAGAGLWGDSAQHPGVWGTSENASGVAGLTYYDSGVSGLAIRADGVGVQGSAPVTGTVGIATNTSGPAWGVYGKTSSGDGIGVYGTGPGTAVSGFSTGTSGYIYGVRGRSASRQGAGVAGFNVATSGDAYGVFGRSDSQVGTAIYGIANADTGNTIGVHGKATSVSGKGVYGEGGYYGVFGSGTDPSGLSYGVYGETGSTAPGSSGVRGVATATSGVTYGVVGQSRSPNGYGLYSEGNAHIEGALSWRAVTHYFSLPAAAFVPSTHSLKYENTTYLRTLDDDICYAQKTFVAPIHLPDGATIKMLRDTIYTRGSPWRERDRDCADLVVKIRRVSLVNGEVDVLMTVRLSGDIPSGSYRAFSSTTIDANKAVIDNLHYAYHVLASLPGGEVGHDLVGATIQYETTGP